MNDVVTEQDRITSEVLARIMATPDPRQREIGMAVVRHLHALVSDVRPTQSEWEQAISFLTSVGQSCSATRQEFILLSDTLGISTLIDALVHDEAATQSTVLGPFYLDEVSEVPSGSDISAGLPGAPLHISGSVADGNGIPIAGALVDVWHSGDDGFYDVQRDGAMPASRARFRADAQGCFHFWTIKPSAYPIPHDGPVGRMLEGQGRHPWRPAHLHFLIQAPRHARLVTQLFVAGDRYLDSDAAFGVKPSLIRDFVEHAPGAAPGRPELREPWFELHHDFRLGHSSERD